MPELTPYTLQFKGGLHVGTRGVNLEEAGVSIPSDSLFAAILSTLRLAGEDVGAFADAYIADPPFLLTSAFPVVGGVRFYPMPADAARLFRADTVAKYGKKLGKINYISEGLVKEALKKGNLDDWLFPEKETETPKTGVTLQGTTLWLKVDEIKSLPSAFYREEKHRHALPRLTVWKTMRAPRVTIDRITSATNIFHAGKVEFASGCGLWFGVHWLKPEAEYAGKKFKDALDTALKMMQDDGVGGERTTGYGAFTLVDEDENKKKPVSFDQEIKPGGLGFLLSRYHPRGDEAQTSLQDSQAAYRLTPVAGWLHTYDGASQRRKRVFLVEEGGLIRAAPGVMGDVVDVRPEYNGTFGVEHPVYRHGLAFLLAWPADGGANA